MDAVQNHAHPPANGSTSTSTSLPPHPPTHPHPTSLSTYMSRPLSSLTPSELGNMPIGLFIDLINNQYGLNMTRESIQTVTKTLQDQWFNNANELRLVDQQAFEFLDLPRPLVNAIFSTFHSKSSPSPLSPHHLPIPAIRITSQSISTTGGMVKSLSSSSLSATEGGHRSPSSSARSLLHPHLSHSTSMNESEGGLSRSQRSPRSHRNISDDVKSHSSSDDEEDSDDDHRPSSHDEALDLHMLEGADTNEADKQKSLNALKQAVEHVCNMSITDEFMLERLRNVIKQGIENSDGKITQSILRDHLKKLQAASKNVGSDESLLSNQMSAMNIAAEVKEAESVTALSPSSSAAIPLSLTGTPDPTKCGRCGGNRDNKPIMLDCNHRFCSVCLRDYILQLIGMKRAVGIQCPWSTCSTELTTANVQSVLGHEDFENYLQATLMAFIEQDGLTFVCPNAQCNAAISVSPPPTSLQVPNPMTELDDEGRPLTRETWLHFSEFRVRCRDCNTVFCAKCKVIPYHKGYTCAGYVDYQSARHCRFCHSKLDDDNTCKEPAVRGPGLRDVCNDDDCIAKMNLSCDKILPCGCVCCGIKNETECLPCLKHELEVAEDYCPICYVEALKDAPCIAATGACKHIFHYQCVKDKLAAKWPGARVTFEFRTCPVCKQNLQHPALADVLLPILELEHNVKEKAIARLKYEGRDKAPEVINKTGQYYNNPIEFAMKLYLFFMCYECKKPYFAGGYQCQEANAPFDPKELICPGCQPSSVEDCPTHGKDWLAYKCRYCCNYANWFCWGTSHFCDKCHKSGVWQQLAVFRTGKNKKKLWEYEQCPSLRAPMDVIARDKSLTDDQKTEKMSKLLSVSSQCVLGVRHPPNGMEFGLGCSMCADNKGDFKSADRTKLEEQIKQKLLTVKNELSKSGNTGKIFTYVSDFDMNGVMYYLGTCGKTQPYSNPCEAGFVRVTSSGLMGDSAPLSAAVGRDLVRCVTTPVRNSWFCFDLIDISLCPTHYTLKHYSSWDTECLRNWVLEGSTDGGIWDLLITHDNDEHLNRKGATHTWSIDARGRRYSQFRVVQTGRNSNNNYYLPMSGFEIYGTLYSDVPQHQHMLESIEMKSPNFKTFTPQSDFDQNGIIWYLGTQNGAVSTWTNPAETGIMRVLASELAASPPSAPASAAIGREVVRCVTASKPNQWFLIDFKDRRIQPTHYTLRHYNSWDLEALRNWRFEGSTDGQSWYTIMNHVDDQALDRKGASHTWTLPPIPGAFSMFRIWQTGLNSNNHHYLALSGFEIYGKLWEVEIPEMQNGQLTLRYSYDFDANGLFYWIGTRGKKQPWRNPAEAGWVAVHSSPLATNPPSAPPSAIVGREVVRCVTIPKPDQWFLIDLKSWKIQPTHYTLRHYNSWDTEALRWWRFEASNDGHTWDLLHAHYNDKALNKKGGSHTWVIPAAQRPYRLFRIHQTDVNSNNNHYLACSGIEMYGHVVLMEPHEMDKPITFTPPIPSNQAVAPPPMAAPMAYQAPQSIQPRLPPQAGYGQAPPAGYHPPLQNQYISSQHHPSPPLSHGAASPNVGPPPVLALHPQSSPPLGAAASPPIPFHRVEPSPSVSERMPPYREFQDGMEFKYQHDFDVNGLMYYLGTKGYTQPWQNPALLGSVRVTSVPLAVNPRSEPAHAIVGRSTVRCVTLPNRESWFCIELINLWIKPTAYSLKHYDSWDTEALRDWKLQGSADGKKWTKLISHKKDTALNAKGATHTWPLPKAKKSYRFFRILQTGKNSNGHWYCALSGFEIYGKVYTTRK